MEVASSKYSSRGNNILCGSIMHFDGYIMTIFSK
jgi:hypothetical protein